VGFALTLWLVVPALFALPAPARATGSVYVTNNGSPIQTGVSQYAIGAGGLLSPLSPPSIAAGTAPFGVALSPDGKSAYVANIDDNTVSQFSVDPLTGSLSTKSPATVVTGANPEGVAVTPDGKSAYVTNNGPTNDISQYNINPLNGALSPKTPATIAPPGATPLDVTVSPDGKSAYVTTNANISQYNIDPSTGALSPKTPASVGAGEGFFAVAVSPDGKSAYASNLGVSPESVSQYTIDPLTGALSPKTPATVAAGEFPEGIAVASNGKSAYVVNIGDNTVSQFSVDPVNGALSPKTPATVAAGKSPQFVAVTPDGKNAYVTNPLDNTVSQYNIDSLTGALSPKTPATVVAGTGPAGIAVGRLPAPKHPTAAHAKCSPAIVVARARRQRHLGMTRRSTTCTATVSDTATSGHTTPTGTVVFATSGPGNFRGGASCALIRSTSGAASCHVTYRPQATPSKLLRTDTIVAIYTGDPTHAVSAATTTIKVVSIP
jgi:DNA-binding beta-propeller fold protein YncE